MNRPLVGRILSVLVAFYLISFAAFFAYSMITFPHGRLLSSMRWEYALKRGLVLFTDFLIPVNAAGIAVAVSLAGASRASRAPRAPGAPSQPFNRMVSSTLVTFILLAAGYTVLFEAVHPTVLRRLSTMEYQSRVAGEYLARAEESREKRDYRASQEAVANYLAIDPGNKEVSAMKLALEPLAAKQKSAAAALPAETRVVSPGMDAQDLIEKARYSFEKGDWFSAHYYAQQAARVDPSRADALRLAVQAWDRIASAGTSTSDAASMELFRKKTEAYQLLANANDPVAAYYRFLALSAEYPKDQDIATYLAKAGEEARKVSFFLDEARDVESLPGTRKILFLDKKEAGFVEAVNVGKMVETARGTTYLLDIEAIRYNAGGAVAWHFNAPYGKLHSGVLLMYCIDRKDPTLQFLPVYYQGTRSAAERNILALRPTVEELRALSMESGGFAAMGLPDLWRLRANLGSFGLSGQSLRVDMAMKALMPFAFLVFSLFSLSLGWAFRARYAGRPSAFAFILIPLVPLVVSLLSLLYIHAHRIVLGFAVLAFGFTAAALVFAGLQLALLAVALVLIAGQASS